MDERFRQAKNSFKISIESRHSNVSSCRSLERPSWTDRPNSLSKNHSFIEVMSLQSNRKSDIYDKMLEQGKPLQRQSLGGIGVGYSTYEYALTHEENLDIPNVIASRKSEQVHPTLSHTCKCYSDCEWETCSCMQARDQLCIAGYCCQGCIKKKNALLQTVSLHIQEQQKIFCTCKKTKCNKKYCSCFASGIMCGDKCSCEGCINCPRKSDHGMDVQEEEDPISMEQLAAMQMPQHMEFQPFNFYQRNSNS